jgi:hypothetical protein
MKTVKILLDHTARSMQSTTVEIQFGYCHGRSLHEKTHEEIHLGDRAMIAARRSGPEAFNQNTLLLTGLEPLVMWMLFRKEKSLKIDSVTW